MRHALKVAAVLAMTSISSARQAPVQYLISTRVLAGNPLAAGSVQVLMSPLFRVPAGTPATMDLGDDSNSFRLAVTPTDLGAGKIALHVVAQNRRGAQVQSSTFDLLTGADTTSPTVALRDGTGTFMLDQQGRAMFIEFQTTVRR